MTTFEIAYRSRANRFLLYLLLAHIPVFGIFAFIMQSSIPLAIVAGVTICAIPALLLYLHPHSTACSVALAASTMAASALLIYLGQGRIEYHFHIFSFLAVLISLCSVPALLTAAIVIALHHVIGWLILPAAVFSYAATFADVLLHAVFVVMETGICCVFARQLSQTLSARGILEEQVSATVSQLSDGTAKMASFMSQFTTAAALRSNALEEVARSSVRIREQVAEHAKVADLSSGQVKENSLQVGGAAAMITQVNSEMQEVCSANRRISGIISLMNDIARQTNILAVNASIEASRSGNSGGGFGVIADQVRELAARTTAATTDIESIISTSVDKVTASARVLGQVHSAMSLVDKNTAQIASLISQLSSNGRLQNGEIVKISNAMERLSLESQEVASAARRNSGTTEELQSLATKLEASLAALG